MLPEMGKIMDNLREDFSKEKKYKKEPFTAEEYNNQNEKYNRWTEKYGRECRGTDQ